MGRADGLVARLGVGEVPIRLWTIHPKHLDARGLVAAWREGLLAQKVLQGRTRGYRFHPQLTRFRAARDPVAAIGAFLHALAIEARARGYSFDESKIATPRSRVRLRETSGQLAFEWAHLRRKLRARDPRAYATWRSTKIPDAHPVFRIVDGPATLW